MERVVVIGILLLLWAGLCQAQHDSHDDGAEDPDDPHAGHDHGDEPKSASPNAWLYAILSSFGMSALSFMALLVLSVSDSVGAKARMFFVGLGCGSMLSTALLSLIPEGLAMLVPTVVGALTLAGVGLGVAVESGLHYLHPAHEPKEPSSCGDVEGDTSSIPKSGDVSKRAEETGATVHTSSIVAKLTHPVHNASLAWSNIVADGIHNFADGVLLGFVFLSSAQKGLLVLLAISFHEIPQELGDYFILLHAGWSPRRALVWNFISALTAVFGAILGLAIGEAFEEVVVWCLPVVAGQFLHISLSQLLPEIMSMHWSNGKGLSLAGLCLGGSLIASLLAIPASWGHSHG